MYPEWLHSSPRPYWARLVCLPHFFPRLKQRECIQWSLFATNRVASTPCDLWHFGPVDNLQKGSVPACFPGGVVFSIFHGFHRYSGATEAGFWKSMGGYRLKWSPACEESLKNFWIRAAEHLFCEPEPRLRTGLQPVLYDRVRLT